MNYKKMIGQKVSLAAISMDDAEKWTEWLNDLEVALPLGGEAYTPITLQGVKGDIDYYCKNNQHVFSIIDNQRDCSIGRCMIFDVDHINRKAMIGLFIGDKACWSKGYGTEAVTLLLEYAFNLLNLNSIMLGCFSFNERAIKCYKKVGFKEIGRRRQARLIGNKYYDGVLMDILASEFNGSIISNHINKMNDF